MQIQMNKRTLSLTFQYDKTATQSRSTTCTIKDISNGERFNDARTLVAATVVKSKKDSDCKFSARKFALKKALQTNILFNKEDRTVIWNQYLAQVNIP